MVFALDGLKSWRCVHTKRSSRAPDRCWHVDINGVSRLHSGLLADHFRALALRLRSTIHGRARPIHLEERINMLLLFFYQAVLRHLECHSLFPSSLRVRVLIEFGDLDFAFIDVDVHVVRVVAWTFLSEQSIDTSSSVDGWRRWRTATGRFGR